LDRPQRKDEFHDEQNTHHAYRRHPLRLLRVSERATATGANSGGKDGEPVNNPSPELVGKLTKELSITPEQAIGGSGRSSASPRVS